MWGKQWFNGIFLIAICLLYGVLPNYDPFVRRYIPRNCMEKQFPKILSSSDY